MLNLLIEKNLEVYGLQDMIIELALINLQYLNLYGNLAN